MQDVLSGIGNLGAGSGRFRGTYPGFLTDKGRGVHLPRLKSGIPALPVDADGGDPAPALVQALASSTDLAAPVAPYGRHLAAKTPGAPVTLRLHEQTKPRQQALAAFTKAYPEGDWVGLSHLLSQMSADGPGLAKARGLDLDAINPDRLILRLCRDPRVQHLDVWLQLNLPSLLAPISGASQRLDHLNELREAVLRLPHLPADQHLSIAETSIPGTDRYADVATDRVYCEVKTVREPITGWSGVTHQVSEAFQKFRGAIDDGREREAVVYAALDPRLRTGINRGAVRLVYQHGWVFQRRRDNHQVIRGDEFWAPLLDWLNAHTQNEPPANPGMRQVDRLHLRLEDGPGADFEREGLTWHRRR